MNFTITKTLKAAGILGLFSLAGIGLVSQVFQATEPQIAENERQALLRSLRTIVPDHLYDNDILTDTIQVTDVMLGSAVPVTVYRARSKGQPIAAVINTIAPDGYNGKIKLLVAVRDNGSLAGVRVVAHKETPGLGDSIEESRSNWVLGFEGKSLTRPAEKDWAVKRDGGDFDQFTGATITPRAIVKAVKNTLVFYQKNKSRIFSQKKVIKELKAREEP